MPPAARFDAAAYNLVKITAGFPAFFYWFDDIRPDK
jgi:hypothetical protein